MRTLDLNIWVVRSQWLEGADSAATTELGDCYVNASTWSYIDGSYPANDEYGTIVAGKYRGVEIIRENGNREVHVHANVNLAMSGNEDIKKRWCHIITFPVGEEK